MTTRILARIPEGTSAPPAPRVPDDRPPSRYRQSQAHIRAYYGIPVRRGLPVVYDDRPGRVTGLDGQYLLIRLDGQDPNRPPLRCHPTWRMAYPTLNLAAAPA